MPIIGAPEHPQVLFAGFNEDDPTFVRMAALVATARRIEADFDFTSVRAEDWDGLVSKDAQVSAPGHMHVLAFGSKDLDVGVRPATGSSAVAYVGSQPSMTLGVLEDTTEDVRRLVMRELVPWLNRQPGRPYMDFVSATWPLSTPLALLETTRPFVLDADARMIAGEFARRTLGDSVRAVCWALPYVPQSPELWFRAALDRWHELTPDRVPTRDDWRERPAWRTAAESTAVSKLESRRREWAASEAAWLAEEAELEGQLLAESALAESGWRRLLTTQGEPLVRAVADALTLIGFEVVDADSKVPMGTPKTEDLRLTSPLFPEWSNVTEVKGYGAGGKTSDFQKIARHAQTFNLRTGALPTSRWYVVNQNLWKDPDFRPPLLQGADEDVLIFSEDGGLAIDTRQLFALVSAIEAGAVDPEKIQTRMTAATLAGRSRSIGRSSVARTASISEHPSTRVGGRYHFRTGCSTRWPSTSDCIASATTPIGVCSTERTRASPRTRTA